MAALGERGVGNDAQRVEAMVARHGPMLLRVANQFSLCHDDALDAYQRALEIYLRRLDTVEPATEGAWLRVVVKHEAMAIRNARASSVETDEVDLDERESTLREVEDTVAGGERVGRSVEALKSLKPDEAKALLLKAEGLSYDEIGRQFGWSYTKVNRSIAEGRKRFLKVYRGIEAGEACERYEPVLDALAGGTATSAQVLSIRPHLRHCAACRATVRSMRFSRTRRIALLGPFAWISRVLSRPEVVQLTSSGGGRFGPAAGLVGLCLTGAGAGAACVMTGALPAAPLIAHHEAKPVAAKHKAKKKVRIVNTAKPTAKSTPEPPPRVYAAKATPTPTPTSTPKPKAKATRKAKPVVHKKKPVVDEFGIEGATPTTAPAKTAAVATTSNVGGGGSSTPKRSSGGGGSSKASSTEFGIEG